MMSVHQQHEQSLYHYKPQQRKDDHLGAIIYQNSVRRFAHHPGF